ncbi:hypothetical protein [Streptomyces syringium]|uniref:hypothetical protein n=1 Tax=Streptomyces syringium TaxID=76729 RepID=UPI00341FE871
MIKRIAAAAVLAGAALTMTAASASAVPTPVPPPNATAGDVVTPPPGMAKDGNPQTSVYPGATDELGKLQQLEKLNELGQLNQVTGALTPVLGILPI